MSGMKKAERYMGKTIAEKIREEISPDPSLQKRGRSA